MFLLDIHISSPFHSLKYQLCTTIAFRDISIPLIIIGKQITLHTTSHFDSFSLQGMTNNSSKIEQTERIYVILRIA